MQKLGFLALFCVAMTNDYFATHRKNLVHKTTRENLYCEIIA